MAISSAAGRGAWAENAVDTLAAHFEQAHNTLLVAEHRLEAELSNTYGTELLNPMKLLHRINKLQEQLPIVEAQCKKLISHKQDFVEKTMTTLLGNHQTLLGLQARAGLQPEKDEAFVRSLHKVIQQWKNLQLSD